MRRGIVGQSRNAVINLIADWRDPLLFIDGEDPVYNAAATNWNGGAGATAGTTRIRVASTAGFSTTRYAPGSWVQLTANPNSVQDAATRKWFSRVVGIESGAIIIEHPLP
ncbi:MAG TPA: hypothetical protein PLW10_18475, partial [Myxococcota bacterium]|nr:hypothetical protein [Myxococcota bacterium]